MIKLAGITLSILLLSVTGFYHADAQTQVQTTTAESSFGVLQINSSVFSASKYSSAIIVVSGEVTAIQRGTPITLQILKPDNTIETQGIIVKKDGDFSVPVIVNGNWPLGNYSITATYGDNVIGTVYFQVVEDTKTTSSTTKLLLYENKQYGFSMKYPSYLQKKESLQSEEYVMYPNMKPIVNFSTSSELTTIGIQIIKDDNVFQGLTGQKFLSKMKSEFESKMCSYMSKSGETCSIQVLSEELFTHPKGYAGYRSLYLFTVYDNDLETSVTFALGIIMYPDDHDIWLLVMGALSGDELTTLGKELDEMTDSFTINSYHKTQQFSLHSKMSQKNDIVYIAIKNPKDSSDDIYGIKLTNLNGKITNFLKIKSWNYVRIGTDSVMYQTTSSPLTPSDLIKIALKVDSKNTEIKWEAFSKDKTSLGTGSVQP